MPLMSSFLLHCDALNSQFTLSREGQDWYRSFESFEDAYEHAESRATGKTPLILYNERGQLILRASISPLARELVRARNRWRKLALAD
jgi:hypothetical protein